MTKQVVGMSLALAVVAAGFGGCTERAARQTVELYDSQQYAQAAANWAGRRYRGIQNARADGFRHCPHGAQFNSCFDRRTGRIGWILEPQ